MMFCVVDVSDICKDTEIDKEEDIQKVLEGVGHEPITEETSGLKHRFNKIFHQVQ